MIVIDASVLVNVLTDDEAPGEVAQAELARDSRWAAPEHVRAEAFSAIRGRVLGRKITVARATEAVDALAALDIEPIAYSTIHRRMWELRENVNGYDAAYVAAAEARSCPLVTADGSLARATGPRCEVRLALPPA